MADVFISYAREDLERVRPLVGAIEGAGYSVFWDRKTPAGMTWRQHIGKALDEAKCVIVVWSESSIVSNWVIEEADDGRRREMLIPIAIEDVTPPLGFRSIQHEDLSDWRKDSHNRRIKSLLNSIERITGKLQQKKTPPHTETRTESRPTKPPLPKQSAKDQKPNPTQRKASFFFKLGSKIVLLTLAAFGLTVGLNTLVDNQRRHDTTQSPKDDDKKAPSDLPEFYTNNTGMKFVLVQAGAFQMGSDIQSTEQPVHQVIIRKPYYMQTTQVTQGQWKRVMGENPSYFKDCGDDCPVENVSWDEVKQFLVKLNEKEGGEYRLPTEAEWEYAARSGGKDQTYAGGENLDKLGWYDENSGNKTHPVGQLETNGLGLYDMSGNVWEWVEDDWYHDYNGAPDDGSAWIGEPRGVRRVIRGGSWNLFASYCRSATRNYLEPSYKNISLDFRLSRSVTENS